MKLIVGLGNPGARYTRTRHNIGRRLAEALAQSCRASFSRFRRLEASAVSLEIEGYAVTVAYPETFMNVSGKAVFELVRHFEIESQKDLLVVLDDVALPLGTLRLRSRGSDGGHNGLKSVAGVLGTSAYARLRLGIGGTRVSAGKSDYSRIPLEEYVLLPFVKEEEMKVCELLDKGIKACQLWVTQPVEKAMNDVNANK